MYPYNTLASSYLEQNVQFPDCRRRRKLRVGSIVFFPHASVNSGNLPRVPLLLITEPRSLHFVTKPGYTRVVPKAPELTYRGRVVV